MKKTITANILALLLVVAACAGLVWLLPAKVMLTLLSLTQLFTLVILGNVIKQNRDHEQDQA